MKRFIDLGKLAAIVAAVFVLQLGMVQAQENPTKKPIPIKPKPVPMPGKTNPVVPDSNVFTKKEKKNEPAKVVDKPTGEKHNGFDVFIDANNKKFYLDQKGDKRYLPEK
ncbi:hypothetical protein [Sphingobacterium suaedae]|uniref:PBCV-specific basic adaptor domain-containing protein n=1 Tax=Sphingobacterium suaedae TaxID=1686402 RepID=A0ABW5KKU7_9SPHI